MTIRTDEDGHAQPAASGQLEKVIRTEEEEEAVTKGLAKGLLRPSGFLGE